VAQTVHLQRVPVELFLREARHTDEIVREFALISVGERPDVTEREVPTRLLALTEQLRVEHAHMSGGIRAQFEEAGRQGEATIDVELPGDETTAEITERLAGLLDAADEYCRSGRLLTLESDPEVVAWRHWWRDQVVGQIREDAEPLPFPSP
jgi:hypothetical protein